MSSGLAIGYANFTAFLLLLTGGMLIAFETQGYQRSNMNKEARATKWLGWSNVILSIVVFGANWVYQKYWL